MSLEGGNMQKLNKGLYIIASITYFLMIAINALANIIPINGVGTGQVSDSYPNLFAPAPITFIIWAIIYGLLFLFLLYQLISIKKHTESKRKLYSQINIFFIITNIINTIWIFAWHYHKIQMTLILMIILLLALITINLRLKYKDLDLKDKLFIRLPFSVYFGWITIASIANVVTYLVSIQWQGFGISQVIWTIIILLVGALIGSVAILSYKSIAYGLVILWAYLGILIKHISENAFDGEYISIILTLILSMILLVAAEILLLKKVWAKQHEKAE